VTPDKLAEAGARYAPRIANLPRPYVAVLLGGESRAFKFPPEAGMRFGNTLAKAALETGGSVLITPSRRTDPATLHAVADAVKAVPHIVWDGSGENPYFAFLSLADAIIVTEDSVNMVTEATGTGTPVYVQALSGRSARLDRFHALMRERGATRPFEGHVDPFDYTPVNDTEAVAAPIRKALGLDSRE
jgi:mitochondrial fission protein ELM1